MWALAIIQRIGSMLTFPGTWETMRTGQPHGRSDTISRKQPWGQAAGECELRALTVASERSGSPIVDDEERTAKKSRSVEEPVGTCDVERVVDIADKDTSMGDCSQEGPVALQQAIHGFSAMSADPASGGKLSFSDMDDVTLKSDGPIPEISFSERVHEAIVNKLANYVIFRLLAEDHPMEIMAWIRLSGLPYRYYTKSLFRFIAGAIGRVVRINYNTADGKRGKFARMAIIVDLTKPLVSGIIIDGQHQAVEYEGLPTIYYARGKCGHSLDKCETLGKEDDGEKRNEHTAASMNELYGLWMQVKNRKKKTIDSKVSINDDASMERGTNKSGSRFVALAEHQEVTAAQGIIGGEERVVRNRNLGKTIVSEVEKVVDAPRQVLNKQTVDKGSNRYIVGESNRAPLAPTSTVDSGIVASIGKVTPAPTMLDSGRHVAVHVVENVSPVDRNIRTLHRTTTDYALKVVNKGLATVKELTRIGVKARRNEDKVPSKPVLAKWMSAMTAELERAENAPDRGNNKQERVTEQTEGGV
ncbi:hypothetical protein F3Y22_tig00111947pilonHSYRG00134 [Hibiscus syriacus]|uniref:Uncharacterized protein n=1 Tax=Hibiscus syriacus TaxID=106335 RepID=A0A6A2YAN1_HIBSY|nr:hypothetical protein F3Y22_tig00111947pilonHSYRG00134 [Hibiscus syriacus]